MPTCICLALEKAAKFLQHKDQGASLGQALGLERKPGGDTAEFISLARLLCGGGIAASPGPPQRHLFPTGERPRETPLVQRVLGPGAFSFPHPDPLFHCTLVDR